MGFIGERQGTERERAFQAEGAQYLQRSRGKKAHRLFREPQTSPVMGSWRVMGKWHGRE